LRAPPPPAPVHPPLPALAAFRSGRSAMAVTPLLPRVRTARRAALPLLLAAAAALLAVAHFAPPLVAGPPTPPAAAAPAVTAAAPAVAFVGAAASSESLFLNRRIPVRGDVAMNGGARRQNRYNKPKKLHVRNFDYKIHRLQYNIPPCFLKMSFVAEPTLDFWSQTLKLSFPEGEDDVVTEDEVREYFTTDDYSPEAVIVGHKLPHDELKHAYVHFATNEEARKARKEKDGGAIGKASEVKVVYTDEKKWVRLRDGVSLQGGPRARWMKPYGNKAYEFADDWAGETGRRNHPVYPVD